MGSLDWGGVVWPQLSGRQARGPGATYWGSGEGGQACFSLPGALFKRLPSSLPRFCPLSPRGPRSSPRVWLTPGPGWPSRTLTSSVPSLPGPAGELCPPWKILTKLQFIRVPLISGKGVRMLSRGTRRDEHLLKPCHAPGMFRDVSSFSHHKGPANHRPFPCA